MSGGGLVLSAGALLAAPSPSDGQEFNSVTVSPGLPGFFAMFVLAVLVVLLAVDMTRRTRRVQAQERVQQRIEAEERAEHDRGEQVRDPGVQDERQPVEQEQADGGGSDPSSEPGDAEADGPSTPPTDDAR
ncbi:hypothetical protein [Brachybacterium sp.]|uniref:hypothetical protein n=1 Tax=Brachybacterium sp. TaxID=1891286 RepID=UPI002ECFBF9C